MNDSIVLDAEGISKRFGATQALSDVRLTLHEGERVAIMGENGAGKSTLMKVFAGNYLPNEGTMTLAGQPYSPKSPLEAIVAGVATVYQEPNGFPHLSAMENLMMGRQATTLGGWVDQKAMQEEARTLLAKVGLPDKVLKRPMSRLSLAEQQLVLIARAVAGAPKVLILDEPTSILTETEAERLFELVDGLTAHGTAVCYITHRFDELERIADRFVVLRDGRLVGETATPDRDELLSMMGGRDLARGDGHPAVSDDAAAQRSAAPGRRHDAVGSEVLSLRHLSVENVFTDISLSVAAGRIVGLYGLVGAGRSELALTILGELPMKSGEIVFEGKPYTPRSVRTAINEGIAYLPEDRKTQGILQFMSVEENVSIAALPTLERYGAVDAKRERSLVREWVDRIRIKTESLTSGVTSLSGGNQQKVLFARLLALQPDLLILDEPTRGIDVATKAEIHRHIRRLADQGVAVLLISSEMAELLELSDVVHVLHEGAMVSTYEGEQITESAVLRSATGMTRQ